MVPLSPREQRPGSLARQLSTAFYVVGSETEAREVLQRLQARFLSRVEGEERLELSYYDTFDWRIYRDEGTLTVRAADRGCQLAWETSSGTRRHRCRGPNPPAFAWDLPAGPFRNALRRVIGVRRLLPIVRVQGHVQRLRLLDPNEKTVVRVRLEHTSAFSPEKSARPQAMERSLRLLPVRGYQQAYEETQQFVENELVLRRSSFGSLASALNAIGQKPAAYSSKFRLLLDPRTPAECAAKAIHRKLLDTIVTNEEGVCADLDSEFLHDFRVAVRRTRSCLGQIKGVFAPKDVEKFRNEFSWLGRLSGPNRDLDVYLLKMDSYRKSLPEEIRSDLEPLHDFLEQRHKSELTRLTTSLHSERYRALIRDWGEFLNEEPPPGESLPNAGRPILEVASERIASCHRRVLKLGRSIGADSPASKLHRLRIDCKKLRYLLEFFASLYRPAGREALVKELKGLQDNLGDFNDLQVQQEALTDFARQMLDEGTATVESLLAMGRLVEQLGMRQRKERARFAKRFADFASPENQAQLDRLLATRPRPAPVVSLGPSPVSSPLNRKTGDG